MIRRVHGRGAFMKCFYHRDADAVGACKNCGRGLCGGCTVEREDGLACRGRCEAKGDAMVGLIQRHGRLTAGASQTSILALTVYLLGGVVFAWLAFQEDTSALKLMLGVLAAIMLVCALGNARVILSRGRAQRSS